MGKEWKQYRNERDGKDGGRMNVLRKNESNNEIRKRKNTILQIHEVVLF